MKNTKKILVALVCAVVLLAALYYSTLDIAPKIKKFDTSDRHTLNILFIGNSYTFFNDMPATLEDLANYDPSSQFVVNTEMLVEGGATLAYFLKSQRARDVLASKKWDYIVLQPQSEWVNSALRTRNTELAISIWRKRIKEKGTRLIFFMTWARQPKTDWYKLSGFSQFKNYQAMHNAIKNRSVGLAKTYNMMLAPIGDHWTYAADKYPNLNLYNKDGSHPSPQGSFLIALILYNMLVDSTVDDIIYWPYYINAQKKHEILELVSKEF